MRTMPLLLMPIFAGCASHAPAPTPTYLSTRVTEAEVIVSHDPVSATLAALTQRGRVAVEDLKRWYDSETDDCGGPDKPGYLCSGIALRTTGSSPEFLPWNPSASQLEKGAVAFSWLRHDTNFGKPFGNQNGLILAPPQAVPDGKLAALSVLCTFPINANTNQRPSLNGCGPISAYPDTDTCQSLDVNTAQQWLDKYPQAGNYRVCGWDLRHSPGSSAQWFQTAVEARKGLADELWSVNNEVLISVWSPTDGGRLPLHAFFYVEGERSALAKAQYDQIRYAQMYQQSIPVVRVSFPTHKTDAMTFTYDEHDQAVGRPTPIPEVDFDELDVGSRATVTSKGVEFRLDRGRRGVSDQPHEESGGKIIGKHLEADTSIRFVLEGQGRREVTFSWGCNTYCGMHQEIAGEWEELSEEGPGQFHYGTRTFTVDGPEVVVLTVDTEEDDALLVLDNLKVTAAGR
ncbi:MULTISPECIES: hypothetical protein [unclassified Pseudomonas]|uniref:hypothetical protein n=1 Tax=unclassified Pseudomonas TaxID=196821 RepID=UPI0035C25997